MAHDVIPSLKRTDINQVRTVILAVAGFIWARPPVTKRTKYYDRHWNVTEPTRQERFSETECVILFSWQLQSAWQPHHVWPPHFTAIHLPSLLLCYWKDYYHNFDVFPLIFKLSRFCLRLLKVFKPFVESQKDQFATQNREMWISGMSVLPK